MSASRFSCLTCAVFRLVAFLGVWTVVSGFSIEDLAVGTGAAMAATWASIAFLPCRERSPGFAAWAALILRMPFQALAAGADVARRALDPALPLRPGFIAYSTTLPEGVARPAFAALAALQPGAVPIRSDRQGTFDVHCLDVGLPVETTLARDEAALRKALGEEGTGG